MKVKGPKVSVELSSEPLHSYLKTSQKCYQLTQGAEGVKHRDRDLRHEGLKSSIPVGRVCGPSRPYTGLPATPCSSAKWVESHTKEQAGAFEKFHPSYLSEKIQN